MCAHEKGMSPAWKGLKRTLAEAPGSVSDSSLPLQSPGKSSCSSHMAHEPKQKVGGGWFCQVSSGYFWLQI